MTLLKSSLHRSSQRQSKEVKQVKADNEIRLAKIEVPMAIKTASGKPTPDPHFAPRSVARSKTLTAALAKSRKLNLAFVTFGCSQAR